MCQKTSPDEKLLAQASHFSLDCAHRSELPPPAQTIFRGPLLLKAVGRRQTDGSFCLCRVAYAINDRRPVRISTMSPPHLPTRPLRQLR